MGRSTGSAARGSTRRACSRPCSTTVGAVAGPWRRLRPRARRSQMYILDTAILVTRFLSESGIAEVVDFMPIDRPHMGVGPAAHRAGLGGIRGEVEFEAS